jgi:hypothetical protein
VPAAPAAPAVPARALLAVLALLALGLAGCVGTGGEPRPFLGGEGPPALGGGWYRDCTISNWADPCTAKATQTQGPANELMLAINPEDPGHVLIGAKDYSPGGSDCVWAGTSLTRDGGRTWTNGFVGGPRSQRDARLAPYDCVTDPVLDWGPDGRIYYLVEAYGAGQERAAQLPDALGQTPVGGALGFGAGSNMWLAVSDDGGSSWQFRGMISIAPGSVVLLHDKSDLAVSPTSGTIVASWTAFNAASSQLVYVRSTDGGTTFSAPRPLMEMGPERANEATAMVDLDWDADGTLHAIWFNWNTGDVLYAQSDDDGATFSVPQAIAPGAPWTGANAPNADYRIFDSTMLAVDLTPGPRRGWLYATWADDLLREGDHDVWFVRSADGGASWSTPVQVGSWQGSDQFHPNLVVAGDGSVHLSFYDRRYGPNNTLLDVTHGISLDGGDSWSFLRVTNSSFDGDLGIHQSGVPFMGDYNGIGAVGNAVWVAYADTRDGRSDVAVAKFQRLAR